MIDYIKPNEPVTAHVANRPSRDIVQLLSKQQAALDAYTDTGSNSLYDQPLSPDVYVGAPVYYNRSKGVYDLARATAHVENSRIVADECASVIGIVIEKTAIGTGHILIHGVKKVNLSNATGETKTGLYFLSAAQSGKLVQQNPGVTIPVCSVLATENEISTVFVAVDLEQVLSSHKHYTFKLNNVPAGNCNAGSFVITNQDSGLDGWLHSSNADHPDSVFKYNISQSSLKDWFPAITPDLIRLYWTVQTGDAPITAEVPRSFYEVTYDGIYWMTAEHTPWQPDVQFENGVPADEITRTMEAWYLSVSYGNNLTVVESLTPEVYSGLEIYQENDAERKPAKKGPLKVDLDLNLKRTAENQEAGYNVLKDIRPLYDSEGNILSKSVLFFGPAVEGIKINSRSVTAKSQSNTYNGQYAQGLVTLDLADSWYGYELGVESIHLDNMMDSVIGDVRGITFYSSSVCGFSGQVQIPSQLPNDVNALMRFLFVAQTAGSYNDSNFTFSYKVIPSVTNGIADFPMSTETGSLIVGENGSATTSKAYQMFQAVSNPILVTPGSILWFSLYKNSGLNNLTVIKETAVLSAIES
jgi:hypothetical protein